MGYTHYWQPKAPLTSSTFARIKAAAEKVATIAWNEMEIDLCGPMGERGTDPEFTDTHISLNGQEGAPGERDLSHETFRIEADAARDFNFCKTAMKPYDVVVTAILCLCEHYTEGKFGVSSDGAFDEWEAGLNLARRIEPDCQIPAGV